jgi:hypothetical protein
MKNNENMNAFILNGIDEKIRYVYNLINWESAEGYLFMDKDTFIEVKEFHSLITKEAANLINCLDDIKIKTINEALIEIQEVIDLNKEYYSESE